jgi:hypothetical protein
VPCRVTARTTTGSPGITRQSASPLRAARAASFPPSVVNPGTLDPGADSPSPARGQSRFPGNGPLRAPGPLTGTDTRASPLRPHPPASHRRDSRCIPESGRDDWGPPTTSNR